MNRQSRSPLDPYADQLLQVPGAVIAENDTHILVAVRLDKRTISDCLGFLAALSDFAHREPDHPAR
jgi:hypothetical protein